jgi:hypothetical protein
MLEVSTCCPCVTGPSSHAFSAVPALRSYRLVAQSVRLTVPSRGTPASGSPLASNVRDRSIHFTVSSVHSIPNRLVAAATAISLVACTTLEPIADRRAPGTNPSVSITALLKPADYVLLTYKDTSRARITITSISPTEIVGVHDGSDVQDHIKIEDLQVVEKTVRSPGKTVLLVLGAAIGGVLAFFAIVQAVGFNP